MTTNLTDPQAPVTDEELDHLIWGLERYALYPRQLAALKELRELRKAKGEPVADVVAWHKEGEERTCDIRWRRFDIAPGPITEIVMARDLVEKKTRL